ncbi:MAG: Na+/H+ antiporter subunit E [Candidatus Aenigmatarchaeota archaeon]
MKGRNLSTFIAVFSIILFIWIMLSGLSPEELIAGTVASLIVSSMCYKLFTWRKNYAGRFLWFIAYIPYYIYAEMKAHLEVIYSIISGKIKPGIVEIENPHKSDFGTTVLANSITMTPGTLSLEIAPGKIYVHCLRMKRDKTQITSGFEKFLRRVWE